MTYSNRRSTALSSDGDTMIDAGHSCVTAAQCTTAEAVVMVQVCMAVQSPNNTIAAENMAVDCHALVQIDSANLADF